MTLNWYQCKECGITIKKDSKPSSSGCPEATFHDWKNLGEFGDTNYCCKECGIVIQTKYKPGSSGCREATFHNWKSL
jgi:hypothetical protein